MTTTARHQEISKSFLEHAESEFEKGDLLEASEKAWGAVAHHVKSVARARGWPNRSHRDVVKNAERLIDSSNDPRQYVRMFAMVENLHVNFYEEKYSAKRVRQGLDDARALIDGMRVAESRLPAATPGNREERASQR